MEDSEDLDDLPAICLDSSVGDATLSFEMPDARTIAAQRRLASEQEAEIKRYQKEMPPETSEDPVAPEILNMLKKSVPIVTMPLENPGIELSELNRMDVIDEFEGQRAVFLIEILEMLPQCCDKALREVLNWYLDSIDRCIRGPDGIEREDNHCNVVALSLIALDRKCRGCIDMSRVQALLMTLLNRSGKSYQSEEFLKTLTENLLKIVTHFHDRLVLSELFNNANVCPDSLEKSEYFSSKLAMTISISSLAFLLGYKKPVWYSSFTETDLKNLVVNCSKWHTMNPYEQYYVMTFILNLLKTYALTKTSRAGGTDDVALKELMLFISSMKCNEKWNNGEFLKVKNLISKTKLFVQSKRVQDYRNMSQVENN